MYKGNIIFEFDAFMSLICPILYNYNCSVRYTLTIYYYCIRDMKVWYYG